MYISIPHQTYHKNSHLGWNHVKAYIVMTQKNTNSVDGNNNLNPNIGRGGGRGQGDFGGHGGCRDHKNNISIAKSLFEDKVKDGCLHKITITEGSHQATQLKKIRDALPILCANKNFKYLNDIICNN